MESRKNLSPLQWTISIGVISGIMVFVISYGELKRIAPEIGVIVTLLTAGTTAVLWWFIVERPKNINLYRGGLVGALSAIGSQILYSIAYLFAPLITGPSISDILLLSVVTIPIATIFGVTAGKIREYS